MAERVHSTDTECRLVKWERNVYVSVEKSQILKGGFSTLQSPDQRRSIGLGQEKLGRACGLSKNVYSRIMHKHPSAY